jgi:predicted transcriptional regulator
VSEVFKHWREVTLNLTQEQFAERVGLSQSAIHQYESGKRIPDLRSFRKIWAAFPGIEPLPLVLMFVENDNVEINL